MFPRLTQSYRDTKMVLNGLLGRRAAATVTLEGKLRASVEPAFDANATRSMRVAAKVLETPSAVTLQLEELGNNQVEFHPGQFLSVQLDVFGAPVRRAYSISSAAHSGTLAITIKRVEGGLVSNYLCERVRPGDILTVTGPSGRFVATPCEQAQRHLVLIAGGSGITPIMSIARSLLPIERRSRLSLLYGNERLEEVIFAGALAELCACYPDRFQVRHVLREAPAGWNGAVGVLDREMVRREVEGFLRSDAAGGEYYVCGPEGMMDQALLALAAMGVPSERTHQERFFESRRPREEELASKTAHNVTLHYKGRPLSFEVPPGSTILEAAQDAGVRLPFSCTLGGCGACRAQLGSGQLTMEEPNCLSAQERERGYVLTCVARPSTPCELHVIED